jgi:hypothetical protein
MPAALTRACHVYGCSGGSCEHRRAKRQQYPSRTRTVTEQGYGHAWAKFRSWYWDEQFRQEVPDAGLCGSRLPGASLTADSACQQQGYIVKARVLDHIRPVLDRHDPDFFNPLALQALCDECHNRKRQRESRG